MKCSKESVEKRTDYIKPKSKADKLSLQFTAKIGFFIE